VITHDKSLSIVPFKGVGSEDFDHLSSREAVNLCSALSISKGRDIDLLPESGQDDRLPNPFGHRLEGRPPAVTGHWQLVGELGR
jgi:hypothetical protein